MKLKKKEKKKAHKSTLPISFIGRHLNAYGPVINHREGDGGGGGGYIMGQSLVRIVSVFVIPFLIRVETSPPPFLQHK